MTDNLCSNREVYALGGLDEQETRAFEEHLAFCPECQAEIANLRPMTDELLFDFEKVPVPQGMRERILENVLGEDTPLRPNTVAQGVESLPAQNRDVPSSPTRRQGAVARPARRAWVPWTSAAAVVAVVVIGSLSWVTGNRSNSPLGQVTKSMALTATTSSGSAKMWVTSSFAGKQMLMHFTNLQKVSGQQVYQVWFIQNGQQPVSAGVFTPNANGNAVFASLMPAGAYQVVAVTLEPKAIDAQPLGSIVFKGSLT